MNGTERDPQQAWASSQRVLSRALGYSLAEWMAILESAAKERAGLLAAAIGAATAAGLGASAVRGLDADELLKTARTLIDPRPPRVSDPVVAEAIRRADDLNGRAGRGAARLRKRSTPTTPERTGLRGPSCTARTPDAPGDDD